jgi:hypothetical protein
MTELDLDILFKEKRDEPITVPIDAVEKWLTGGMLALGLFATIKWLFTQKTKLMFTSISSISIATTMAILFFNSSSSTSLKTKQQASANKPGFQQELVKSKSNLPIKNSIFTIKNARPEGLNKINILRPNQVLKEQQNQLLVPGPNASSEQKSVMNNEVKFTRINTNGFVHFTLVKGTNCSVQDNIPYKDGEPKLQYSIKNGVLFLNSASENKASDLIITVSDLEKINLNGFCEMTTNSEFKADELELDINGFSNLNIDLNVDDLEIELNGETKGKMNLKSKHIELESNGFCELEITCDFEQSWIEVGGSSKLTLSGNSTLTSLEISGENTLNAENFYAQDLVLNISGYNKKFETTVTSTLDVEISGNNTVIINGSPKIVHQEVMKSSKLKMKE